jgi:hypothetical protein
MFEVPEFASRGAAVMLPFTTTWGWVTWALAWRHLDECSVGWQALREDRALRRRFNLGGVYDYATMMEARIAKRRDSWRGIHWSIFSNDGLAVFPPRSLVHNEGMDGSGSNGRGFLPSISGSAPRVSLVRFRTADTLLRRSRSRGCPTHNLAPKRWIGRQNGRLGKETHPRIARMS